MLKQKHRHILCSESFIRDYPTQFQFQSHYSNKLLARLITGWQTCSWPAAVSIFCLDCRVEEEEVETARLCLSHRMSSHMQDSCKINTRTLVKLEEAIYLIPRHHSKSVHQWQSALFSVMKQSLLG